MQKRSLKETDRQREQKDNKPPVPDGKTGGVACAFRVFGTQRFGDAVSGADTEQVAERGQRQLGGENDGERRQLRVIPGHAHKKSVGKIINSGNQLADYGRQCQPEHGRADPVAFKKIGMLVLFHTALQAPRL